MTGTRMRVLRWLIQSLFLALFVALFALTARHLLPGPGDLFFRFDPLVLIVTSLSLRTVVAALLPALAIIALTALSGRFFCGYVCPLGTCIDVTGALLHTRHRPAGILRFGKYLVLVFLLAGAGLGASFLGWFDPLAIFERVLALGFYPLTGRVRALLAPYPVPIFRELPLAVIFFALILGLSALARRFWCRDVCPLGGMLALLSRIAPFKFRFRAGCRECGLCSRACPTGAINEARLSISPGECISCFACRYACRDRLVRFGLPARRHARPEGNLVPDPARRQALIAAAAGIVLAPAAVFGLRTRRTEPLLRPPGALPEPDFLDACLRCDRCLKACPTRFLQPCVFEAGLESLWTPRAVPRNGGCERSCNLCGQVCPTGAIRRLSLEEKSYARIGTAVVNRPRCIAWAENRDCLICDEACPYNAIEARFGPGRRVLAPVVDERICTGCGVCEARCPVQGQAAIRVFPARADRLRSGSYVTPEKVRLRCGAEPREELPRGFIE